MRNRHPENTAESANTPNYHRDPPEEDAPPSLMAYPSLETLQQRLDAFEDHFADQNQQDDGPLLPRIARVAPMSATAGSTRDHQLPARNNPGFTGAEVAASATARATATATMATVSAPASVAAATATGAGSLSKATGVGSFSKDTGVGSFSKDTGAGSFSKATGAGNFSKATGTGSFSKATNAAAVAGRAAAGAARTVGVRATVWNAPHSAADASATSNTATYASPRGRYVPNYTRPIESTGYQPYLVCVASTAHHNYCKVDYNSPAMSAYVGGPYSNAGSSYGNNFAETLANSNLNPEAPVFRPRMFRDAEMTDVSAREPFKVAKRSEQHTSIRRNDHMVAGPSRNDDDEDMDVDV